MLIDTIHGLMEESMLEKRQGMMDTDIERTLWVEYWKDGELVHRSAHVVLKQPVVSLTTIGGF